MQLLDPWFSDFMNMSFVGSNFEIDGGDEEYEPFFEVDAEDGDEIEIIEAPDGYTFQSLDTWESPGVVLRDATGDVIGFYYEFSSWVEPEHRGQGLGALMILAYAEHYKDHAWEIEREKYDCGTAFSPGGFAIHSQAMRMAERKYGIIDPVLAEIGNESSAPAPM